MFLKSCFSLFFKEKTFILKTFFHVDNDSLTNKCITPVNAWSLDISLLKKPTSGQVENGVVMKSGFWYFYRYFSMLRNLKYKFVQEWTLLLKIKYKIINFQFFFYQKSLRKIVLICHIAATRLRTKYGFPSDLKVKLQYVF